ncbi:MAG TPA: hypothetical protein VM533_20875 [Fimbriiglobus sp.]|jgi:hypothetical protein|nr:hypothetical protein [Fimbriiglobus sp.]
MSKRTRRELLADVGKGMFLASLGVGVARDLGLSAAWAADEPGRVTFGDLEPLVGFMQETPPEKFLAAAVEKIKGGTDLKTLVSAAALANARAFGGEDYVGFHTLMALPPAYHMSGEDGNALAVLKVLYRNSTRLKEAGKDHADTLKPVTVEKSREKPTGEQLRDQVRKNDLPGAERTFATICASGTPDAALDRLMVLVDDATEVHRVVLVSRAYELIDFVGSERAHTLLRQSVHYCANSEKHPNQVKYHQEVRDVLPRLLERHGLLSRSPGTRPADDARVSELADAVYRGSPAQAAEAVAAALAEGIDPTAVGEAISLAANQLVLRDEGRPKQWASPNKPTGSIHGDSVGVHACDSVLAWRAIAKAGDQRTRASSLVLAAYQVARDRGARPEFLKWEPYPRPEHQEQVRGLQADTLMRELEAAVRDKDQSRAAAITQRVGAEKSGAAKDVFALFRKYAVSEDGALHAEKFFRTATEEYAATRPAFRWRQLVALARVTASAYGQPAPGMDEARRLLKT